MPKKKKKGLDRGKNKLVAAERIFVIRNIAAFKTDTFIVNALKERYNKDISPNNINKNYRYKDKWQNLIKSERKRYLERLDDIPLTHLKNQVIALSDIYNKAIAGDERDLKAAISAIDEIATLMGTKVERKRLEGELGIKAQEAEGKTIEELEEQRKVALKKLSFVEGKREKMFKEMKVVGKRIKN